MQRIDHFMLSLTAWQIAVLALLGATVGILLTPFMAAIWQYEPAVVWSDLTLVESTFGPWLESSGFLTFGPTPSADQDGLPYEVYGKGFFLVYLLMLPVMRSVRPLNRSCGFAAAVAAWSWRGMFVATSFAMVCDFVSYWGKSIPGIAGDTLWQAGGSFEILTVMFLMLVTLVFSASSLMSRSAPIGVSAILIAAVVMVVPFNLLITDYWPNSFIVPISIGCAAVAIGRRPWQHVIQQPEHVA